MMEKKTPLSVILSAGGIGSRMKSSIPKQFLSINEKPVLEYSLDVFSTIPEVDEIVVVVDQDYWHRFLSHYRCSTPLFFAHPGVRRQESVFNGLEKLKKTAGMVCVHDAARPLITKEIVQQVHYAALEHGAAAAAMPIKFTVKETDEGQFVKRTIDRSLLWEIQTPQIIDYALLKKGFEKAIKEGFTVTDDVSLVELLGLPVKLVQGCYRNIKITTPEDLEIASLFLSSQAR